MVFGGVPVWLLLYLAVLGVVSVVVGRRRVARGERLLAAARVTAPRVTAPTTEDAPG